MTNSEKELSMRRAAASRRTNFTPDSAPSQQVVYYQPLPLLTTDEQATPPQRLRIVEASKKCTVIRLKEVELRVRSESITRQILY
eukprot:scaffold27346_cov78-Skeletonema_dohrnii-CCMP3373.AAC.1